MPFQLDSSLQVHAFGAPARAGDLKRFMSTYPEAPARYAELVEEMTGVTLLWNRRGELRLWGPEEALAMDAAYGVSAAIPGAVAIGDNGGGEFIIHSRGEKGLGLYLVEAGSLLLDEDAVWLAEDLAGILERAEGAEEIFKSDPIDAAELAVPRFEEGEYR